ncbi:MAG: IS21 family transposase [Deltaproteobacteria bacterium]|nr:IS21 family transposase [Deltaproteobacteria bacterium]
MPSWSSREELILQVVLLTRQGMGVRSVARSLGVARNTVRKLLAGHEAALAQPHSALPEKPLRAPRDTKVTPWAERIAELLRKYEDITAQRVFETISEEGYAGGYTAIKDHVREVRPRPVVTPSLPTPTHGPGEMAESDWTPCTVPLTGGGRLTVQIHGFVLCHSRRKVFRVHERCDLHALMDAHVATFARLGGVPAHCKYDNQKPVVLGYEGSKPLYNPRFLAFATYYGFRPIACRPMRPNDKPKVERSFWEYERSFLNGREFRDAEDLRAQLARWHDRVCDPRVHKRLKRPVIELFAEEAPYLQPLPRHPYDTARVAYRLCSIDGFVAWDGNRYAVPYEAIYDVLPVRVTERELFVYAPDLTLLAHHELAPRSAGRDVAPPSVHRTSTRRGTDIDHLRAIFEDLGDGARDFFTGLTRLGTRQCSYQARQVLLLRERFTSDDLALALGHAKTYGAFEHRAVARILEARATPRTLAEYVTEGAVARAEGALGRAETRGRDLDEYDRLPVVGTRHKEPPWEDNETPPTPERCSSDCDDTSRSSD